MRKTMRVPPGVLMLALAAPGCVSEQAGYSDVTTRSRALIDSPLRWEDATARPSDAEVRSLLKTPLTLDAALQLAVWLSPTIQSAFVDLGLSRAEMLRAYRPANPSVEAALRFGKDGDTAIELHALEELTSFLLLPLRAGAAESGARAARVVATERVVNHLYFIKAAYFEALAARQLEVQETLTRDTARASAEAGRALESAGNLTEVALMSQLAWLEEAELALAQATTDASMKRHALAEAVGLWRTDFAWTLETSLPERRPPAPPVLGAPGRLEQTALSRSLRLEALRLGYEAATKTADFNGVRGWLPKLGVGVSAEHDEAGWSVGPAAAVTLPLFDQGQADVASSRAYALLAQSQGLESAARIRSQARGLAVRFQAAEAAVTRLEQGLLPMREKLLESTQREFNAMLTGVFQLLQAKRDQLQAHKLHIHAQREYWSTRTQIEQLVAGGMPGPAAMQVPGFGQGASSGSDAAAAH